MHKYPFRMGACQASSLWKVTVGPVEREGLRMAYKCAARRRLGFAPAVIRLYAASAQPEAAMSCCSYWLALARGYPAQFQHSMPDVPVLRQVSRSNRLSAGSYHLVKRTTQLKFGIAI